jgi:hypothetical protein
LIRSNAVDHELGTDNGVPLHVQVEGVPDAAVNGGLLLL